MSKTPYIGFGLDTLEKRPEMKIGDVITCPYCKKRHRIKGAKSESGEMDNILLFFKCRGKIYLAGVAGKSVIGLKPDCSKGFKK